MIAILIAAFFAAAAAPSPLDTARDKQDRPALVQFATQVVSPQHSITILVIVALPPDIGFKA